MIVDYNSELENLIKLGGVVKQAGKMAAGKILGLQDLNEVELEDLWCGSGPRTRPINEWPNYTPIS
mgnify:CR=1 FL=1